ncbi:Gpr107, partial [Symbiodinium pilosum]
VQNILELMTFLLLSLGWKVLRSSLDVSEIRFAVAVSIISFYLGVFQVACTTTATCSGYQLSRYILHSLCFLVVIVAMNFNLQKLVSAIAEAPASLESGKLYRKLSAYYIFRWVFLAFIIAPTVELFLKVTVVPWDALWLYIAIQELRTWGIYALLVHAFRMEPASPRVFELIHDVVSPRDGDAGNDALSEVASDEDDVPAPPWA